MKINVLIRKKQLILACLVVVLGVAVYLNWEFSNNSLDYGVIDDKVYGEAQETVVEVTETNQSYFAEVRMNREKTRAETLDSIETMLKDETLSDEQKKVITSKSTEIAELTKLESDIEELVKANGIRECVAFIDGDNASVVVSENELSQTQAAQIFDIVLKKTKINAENINIVELK